MTEERLTAWGFTRVGLKSLSSTFLISRYIRATRALLFLCCISLIARCILRLEVQMKGPLICTQTLYFSRKLLSLWLHASFDTFWVEYFLKFDYLFAPPTKRPFFTSFTPPLMSYWQGWHSYAKKGDFQDNPDSLLDCSWVKVRPSRPSESDLVWRPFYTANTTKYVLSESLSPIVQ